MVLFVAVLSTSCLPFLGYRVMAVSSWLFFSSHECPVHCSLDKADFTLLFCHVRPLKSALSRMFWHGFLKFQLCRLSCFRSIFTAVPTHLTWYCENLYLLFLYWTRILSNQSRRGEFGLFRGKIAKYTIISYRTVLTTPILISLI